MDTLAPLIELRGEWRSAAAVSVPAAAAEVAAALDRALDLLSANEQLDVESLTMAADVICNALVARPDEIELLRRRLHRALRDYASVAAVRDTEMSVDGAAFSDEESLAAALFAAGSAAAAGQTVADDGEWRTAFRGAEAAASTGPRLDEKTLTRSLKRGGRRRRRWLAPVLRLVALLLIAGGIVLYFTRNPPTLSLQSPTAKPSPAGLSSGASGTLGGTAATCGSGGVAKGKSSCSWTLKVQRAGTLTFTLHWDSGDSLTLATTSSSGVTEGAPVSSSTGALTLTTPSLATGSYTVTVSAPSTISDTVDYRLTEG